MRRVLITTLALCVFATAATAQDLKTLENRVSQHVSLSNQAMTNAASAMKGGDYATGCIHLRQAGLEVDRVLTALPPYQAALAADTTLAASDRDISIRQMHQLEAMYRDMKVKTADQLKRLCS